MKIKTEIISSFLASIQLTTNIHWPGYCTVHVYVVIHLCDNMWKRIFVCLFISNYYR